MDKDYISALLADIAEAVEEAFDTLETVSTKPVLLKALKNQDRFKLSSVWIETEDGKYQHLQSGRTTTAARLAGYTRVINRG